MRAQGCFGKKIYFCQGSRILEEFSLGEFIAGLPCKILNGILVVSKL
jgi:hypothetical protein